MDLRALSRPGTWFPNRTAVIDGGRCLSFADVEARSNRLANALLSLTPGPGSRVALCLQNVAEFIEADLAILKAGMVKVPINPRLSDTERRFILDDSGAHAVIFDPDVDPSGALASADVPTRIAIRVSVPGAARYEDVLGAGSVTRADVEVPPDAPSVLMYTSGTTGRPKGAVWTYGSRFAGARSMLANELHLDRDDAMVHVGSLAHGSGSKILPYWLSGARNICIAKWDPEAFMRVARDQGGTGTFVVPTMLRSLVDAAEGKPSLWRETRINRISYGGASSNPSDTERALDVLGNVLVQVYGSCEAPHPVTVLTKSDHASAIQGETSLASIGRVVDSCDVRIVDESGAEAATGDHGEMWIRGANVMAGYWERPEATAAALANGWYRTGDVARVDELGQVFIVDRIKDMVITGGLNVYSAEVEATISEVPGVKQVAVIGTPDPHWGELVTAVVVADGDRLEVENAIRAHCAAQMAGYKKPRRIEFLDQLPQGSTGKVLKRGLREALRSTPAGGAL